MSGGGVVQLVAYGSQDSYLTGKPKITFFKMSYLKHTNFAVEAIENTFSGSNDFGRRLQALVVRNGDLLTKVYLRANLEGPDFTPSFSQSGSYPQTKGLIPKKKWAWVGKLGHALIRNYELTIGGTPIDKQWGDWLNIWYDLARNFAHDKGYDKMIGNDPASTSYAYTHPPARLLVPLQLFFCKNEGLALPMIALQYHEVRLNMELAPRQELVCYTNNVTQADLNAVKLTDASLWCDYIYVDNIERARFAEKVHEYLVEQLQHTGDETLTGTHQNFKLTFNHPCKSLYWCVKLGKYTSGMSYLAHDNRDSVKMIYDASKRFALRCASYVGSPVCDTVVQGPQAAGLTAAPNATATAYPYSWTLPLGAPGAGFPAGAGPSSSVGQLLLSVNGAVNATEVNGRIASVASGPNLVPAFNQYRFPGLIDPWISYGLGDVNLPVAGYTAGQNLLQRHSAFLYLKFSKLGAGCSDPANVSLNNIYITGECLSLDDISMPIQQWGFPVRGAAGDLFPTALASSPFRIYPQNPGFCQTSNVSIAPVISDVTGLSGTYGTAFPYYVQLLNAGVVTTSTQWYYLTFFDNAGHPDYDLSVRQFDNYGLYLNKSGNTVDQAVLKLNGKDRFHQRDGTYFNIVQPYQHYSNTPSEGVHVYSFALHPENHQPSGTCNFSRIDNAYLNLQFNAKLKDILVQQTFGSNVVKIMALNYNVVRVMGGMGGLAYAS